MKTTSEWINRSGIRFNKPVDSHEAIAMKKALATLVMAISTVAGFPQGKVSLQLDTGSPITLSPRAFFADAALIGQPVPTTGSLPSGQIISVGLYGGTSSTSLSLQGSVVLNPVGGTGQPPGIIIPRNITLTGIPGGSLAYFQVRSWDATYTSYEACVAAIQGGGVLAYTGENNMFTMTPGTSVVYVPINRGGGTTWTNVGNESPFMLRGSCLSCAGDIYIFVQPINSTVVRGGTATFAVGAGTWCNCVSLSYQWCLNGIAIPGASGSSYQITNAQPANAGVYWVQVSAGYDNTVCSRGATLTVLPVPPAIMSPPQSQTAESGADVGFDISATGDLPLVYQWFFNATNALGTTTTNSHLQLDKAQFSQSGAYTVVVTNGGGAVTSPPALLSVIAAVERRPAAALNLTGVLNSPLNLDYTPLVDPAINWVPLDSVLLTNPLQRYVDASSVLASRRFYRGWQTNGPPSILGLNMVPAITLNGAIGSSLRVDYINKYGPVGAWMTNLATVTLTNTSQLYFDVSAIGQPQRLYRLVPGP